MAQSPTGYSSPSTGVFTEVWISPNKTGDDIVQIFGVQTLPNLKTAKNDVTYTVLESDEERAVKGIRPFEALEFETIMYKEQALALEDLANLNQDIRWYVKYPDGYNMVYTWEGSFDIANSTISNDSMLLNTIKGGKSTNAELITSLPMNSGLTLQESVAAALK